MKEASHLLSMVSVNLRAFKCLESSLGKTHKHVNN